MTWIQNYLKGKKSNIVGLAVLGVTLWMMLENWKTGIPVMQGIDTTFAALGPAILALRAAIAKGK